MAKHSVCLFCSAVEDLPAAARDLAAEFGAACARRGLRLVYGGSGRGLMGIAARAAAAAGGEVLEMLTMNDLGLQDKPVILCASDGFWQPFIAMIERFRAYGVLRPSVERRLHAAASVEETMGLIEDHLASAAHGTQAAASRSV